MSRGYWRIQGRGPGDPDPSPLFLVQTENKFLGTGSPAPPYVRVWMTAPPPIPKALRTHADKRYKSVIIIIIISRSVLNSFFGAFTHTQNAPAEL